MAATLSRLELICLGPPTALVDGRAAPPEVLWRKHLALLVYLALSPSRRRTRDHLLGILWPERPQAEARHSLNQAVLRLRRALGEDRLRTEADALALSEEGLRVDALRLAAATESPRDDVVPLLKGDFLEGFHVDEAPEFDDWMTQERERYRTLTAAALVAAGERRLAASRFADAQDLARRALVLHPYGEPAARLLMRAVALAGDAPGALAVFHEFATRLAAGVGEQPSRALAALSERIRKQSWRPPRASEADPEPPLVGRESLHREVLEQLAAGLADGPRTLLITGPPGMGRTRLLTECVERLALEGAVVASARPLPSDHDAPWSTLRLLLRAGLHAAPGLTAAPADALGVLAWLLPELADRFPPRAPREAADVAAALAAVIRAVGEESPIALAIDDAHWSDRATLGVLAAAVEPLRSLPAFLLLTVSDRDDPLSAELRGLAGEIGRRLRGASVQLSPLTDGEIRALVGPLAPWCQTEDERDRLARRLHFEAGGNPFFVVTLLGGLRRIDHLRGDFVAWPPPRRTFETPLPITLPGLARASIAARIAELDEAGRRVACAASIGGVSLDLDLIATLADLPRAGVDDALVALERRQLVTFDGRRYAFVAPLIAEAVRGECLTAGQRQTLRRRAIAVLATRDAADLEARVLCVELLAKVEPGHPAFDAAIGVVRAAVAAGTARTARRALGAAERALGRDAEAQRPLLDQLRAQIDNL